MKLKQASELGNLQEIVALLTEQNRLLQAQIVALSAMREMMSVEYHNNLKRGAL